MLLAAGIALVLMLGGDKDKASSRQTAQSGGTASTGSTGTGPRPTLNGNDPGAGGQAGTGDMTGTGQVVPVNPGGGPPPLNPNAPRVTVREQPRGTGSASASNDYVVGEVRMRDHRGSGEKPIDLPPNIHTPEGPRINSVLTDNIGKQVRDVMLACAKTLSRDGRGPSPRVEGILVTTVKAHQMGVLAATMQPRDLPEATAATLKGCMEPKLVGLTAPAPDQDDLDSYSLSLRMTLP